MAERKIVNELLVERASLGSYTDMYTGVLKEEGFQVKPLDLNPLFSSIHTETALHLFGLIFPDPHDIRWQVVDAYLQKDKDLNNNPITKPKGLHREASLQAIYLSSSLENDSGRNRLGRIDSDYNLRQFARAEMNLSMFPDLQQAFEGSRGIPIPESAIRAADIRGMPEKDVKECYEVVFPNDTFPIGIALRRTNSINETHNPDMKPYNITPSPEALYQIVMFGDAVKVQSWGTESKRNQGKVNRENLRSGKKPKGAAYISRVGFNVHQEEDSLVISVTNIQNNHLLFANFVHKFANRMASIVGAESTDEKIKYEPTVLLLQRVQHLAQALEEQTGKKVEVRGLANPRPKTLEGNDEALNRLHSKYTKSLEAVGISTVARKWHRGAIPDEEKKDDVESSDNKVQQQARVTSIESTPEYRQLASLMFPEADLNALSPEQTDLLHKIIKTGKEILEQNPGISQEKLAQMLSERIHIPGNHESVKPAEAVETKAQEPVQEQKVEKAPQSNEHIITDEYYFNYLNGRFPQYGDLALQLFPGADLANLSPIQIEQIAVVLNVGQEMLKKGESVNDETLARAISTSNIPVNIKEGILMAFQPRVAAESHVTAKPAPETPQRKLSLKEINQRGRRMQAIRRKIQQEQGIQSPYLQSKAVAMDLNGQVYRNGLAAAAVIPIDEHVAYVMVPGTEFRTMVSNWKDQKTVNAILHQKHPSASTTPTGQEWVLKSDYTGDEWQPKKKPEPPPRVVPPLDPTEADPADTAPLPPLQPNVPPTVPGYSAGPPLINPNRANSTLRNKSTGKGKKQAGEVAKTIAEATGSAALIAGKVAGQVAWITAKATGKVALKAGEATAKGAYKVATAKKTREIAWAVTKTTVKVAAYTVLSPVFMYVAAHDDFSSDEGVERVHSPAYWRWRKAGKMAGRAFHETGLAYMKFGAVGGEVFGDHETNEFVDKLYLKKSAEWESDDEQTRQRREQEAQIKRSWNPVNWLGDALNAVNPSVEDIQRSHAEGESIHREEVERNTRERLINEYGKKEGLEIFNDLKANNQGSVDDLFRQAKGQINADRDAQQTEKTWGKIEKQHGKAVADQLRGSGADLTDMGLIHAADDIADRQRREKAAADAAAREARDLANAETKVRSLLGPDAEEFLNRHKNDPANWIIEQAQKQKDKEENKERQRKDYEEWEKRKQEKKQREADEKERNQREKLEREEEERIKAERRKQKEDAERAAQNAENPPQQRQQPQRPTSRTDAQPTPQSQPTTFVPPQPESRPQQQPQPAPQKPDQKPTQTRPSQDAEKGGGFFERFIHSDDAPEERPAKQESKPQRPAQPPVERAPQPRPQRSPEQEPQPQRPQPIQESKPQRPPVQPPIEEHVSPPPPVTVPVYEYTPPPPREEVKPERQPEPQPEPEQKQSSAPDAPISDEPEVLPGIDQKNNPREQAERVILPSDRLDQLHDLTGEIAEQVSEYNMAKKFGGTEETDPDKHADNIAGLRIIRHKVEKIDPTDEKDKTKKEFILKEIDRTLKEDE